jgi:hypothetical protein
MEQRKEIIIPDLLHKFLGLLFRKKVSKKDPDFSKLPIFYLPTGDSTKSPEDQEREEEEEEEEEEDAQ